MERSRSIIVGAAARNGPAGSGGVRSSQRANSDSVTFVLPCGLDEFMGQLVVGTEPDETRQENFAHRDLKGHRSK
jgi:hypothetical protein